MLMEVKVAFPDHANIESIIYPTVKKGDLATPKVYASFCMCFFMHIDSYPLRIHGTGIFAYMNG